MPVAQPFYASGAGNGFPTCLPKIDVTDRGDGLPYDYWTTLSGVNKDNPTTSDALIAESLVLASRLYWFGYSVGLVNTATDGVVSTSLDSMDLSGQPSSEPKDRLCTTELEKPDEVDRNGLVASQAGFSMRLPTRLYNGETTDEANFVGYGVAIPGFLFDFAWTSAETASTFASVQIQSAIENASEGGLFGNLDCAYVELDGMHFVCGAYAIGITSPETLSASESRFGQTSSVQITSLGFYT